MAAVGPGPINGFAKWQIQAPADTTIKTVEVERNFQFQGDNNMRWRVLRGNETILETATSGNAPPDSGGVIYRNVDSGRLTGQLECPAGATCGADGASMIVSTKNFFIELEDQTPPTVTLTPLPPTAPLRGTVQIPYTATDRGSGVGISTELVLDLTPQTVGRTVATDRDDNEGFCRRPFKDLQPCKLALTSSFSLDTTQIPDGTHTITPIITDAASNLSAGASFQITIQNAPTDGGSDGGGPDGGGPVPGDGSSDPGRDGSVPGSGGSVPGGGAPRLSEVSLSRTSFKVGGRGTVLRFSSSAAGKLRVAISKAGAKATRPLATLTRTIVAGRGRLPFSGRIGKKPLRPGRYQLTVTAQDAAGNRSEPTRLPFRILRG